MDATFGASFAEQLVDNTNGFEYKEGTKVTPYGTQQSDTPAIRCHTLRGANLMAQKGFASQNEVWMRVAEKR